MGWAAPPLRAPPGHAASTTTTIIIKLEKPSVSLEVGGANPPSSLLGDSCSR